MKLRRVIIVAATAIIALQTSASAQQKSAFELIDEIPERAAGLDYVYNFDVPALTKAPKGYKPFYISHYGRHGSRYAYSASFYDHVWEVFTRAESLGLLTPLGQDVLNRYKPVHTELTERMGDLCDKGWEQQQRIAHIMYDSFPEVFKGDARIFACSSSSIRSIMSMSGFCVGMAQCDADLRIREEQGRIYLNGTRPREGSNLRAKPRKAYAGMPYDLSPEDFMDRILDVDGMLGKFFTDTGTALGGHNKFHFLRRFFIFTSGMQSLDYPADFRDVFTAEEWKGLWEADNFDSFREYHKYINPDSAILEDMMAALHEHAQSGENGASLRFGHDHCLMPLLMVIGINEFKDIPSTPENVKDRFRTFDSPMAANIQIILYRKARGNGEMLVKVLLNGTEAHLPLDESRWPYYSWDEFAAHCDSVVASYAL